MTSNPSEPVGEIALVEELRRDIPWVARSSATVLVTGESDAWTARVARAVHTHSSRADRPFVTVDCGSADTRLESELFGDSDGSSGSSRRAAGKLALADSGTIFLAGIGEISAAVQARLSRFLETSELETGGTEPTVRRLDVRVVAATSRNLLELIASGRFDEALYYRLNVIHLCVPPLHERSGDIGDLAGQLPARRDLHVPGRVASGDR